MTPQEIKDLRVQMGMTQQKFSHALGISHNTLSNWENGKRPPSQMAVRLLQEQKEKLCLSISTLNQKK
jgi:putative transcriptional regulator